MTDVLQVLRLSRPGNCVHQISKWRAIMDLTSVHCQDRLNLTKFVKTLQEQGVFAKEVNFGNIALSQQVYNVGRSVATQVSTTGTNALTYFANYCTV